MFRCPTVSTLVGVGALVVAATALSAVGVWAFTRPQPASSPSDLFAPAATATPFLNTGPLDDRRLRIGDEAPDFALLDVRDETTVRRLSDYRGKVVLLNWYASWCSPCRREIPLLQRASEALPADLVVLGVDVQEGFEQARAILELFHARYPAVLDANGEVSLRYGLRGLPTTFVISRDGIVLASRAGELRESDLRELLAKAGLQLPDDFTHTNSSD